MQINRDARIRELEIELSSIKKSANPREYNRVKTLLYYWRHPERRSAVMAKYFKKHKERRRYERLLQPPRARNQRQVRKKKRTARKPIDKAFLDWVARTPESRRNKDVCYSLVGCTRREFQDHMDGLLQKHGWTWADRNVKWTFDHVIPVRNFILPKEKSACWHYTNIRPWHKARNAPHQWTYGRRHENAL